MQTTRTRPSLSLFDLVAASSIAESAPPLLHEFAIDNDDVDSSFSALLAAISTATPLPTSPPTTASDASPPTSSTSASSSNDDKHTQRRERNRLSCRKARLKRKLERLSQSLLVQLREERQVELLDLRDELAAATTTMANPLRMFVVKSLHYALLDDEYMAAKQRATTKERLSIGWPTRALTASMAKQWHSITSDVMNPQLIIDEIREDAGETPKETIVQCMWTLRGVSVDGVETRCREEPLQYNGKTVLRFVGRVVTSIQVSATVVKVDTQRDEDDDDETEPDGEDNAYAVTV